MTFTPVDQEPGGCWVACLACITGIPLAEFPKAPPGEAEPTIDERNAFQKGVRATLGRHGWTIAYLGTRVPIDGYAIASGPSPRLSPEDIDRGLAVWHAVVWKDGAMVFDPHASRAFFDGAEPREFEILVRVRAFEVT